MEIAAIIENRRTIRKYRSKKVVIKLLRKVLDAARWAPSLFNLQPWRFIIPKGRTREKIIKVLKKRCIGESIVARVMLKNSIDIIERAPVIILVYNNRTFSQKFKKENAIFNHAALWEAQSIASAIQNMLLTAHSLGLSTAWLGVPLLREKHISKTLNTKDKLMAIITLGYPAEKPNTPQHKPLSEIVSFIK